MGRFDNGNLHNYRMPFMPLVHGTDTVRAGG